MFDALGPPDCSRLPDDAEEVVVPGFAIVGLCCLLIETLQSFRAAAVNSESPAGPCPYPGGTCIRPAPSTTGRFKAFLRRPRFKGQFEDERLANRFVNGVRNGVLHEAETRHWIIWRAHPAGRIVAEGAEANLLLNRSEFYAAVKGEFEDYLKELRSADHEPLRRRFLKKMDDIAENG